MLLSLPESGDPWFGSLDVNREGRWFSYDAGIIELFDVKGSDGDRKA